MKYQNLKYPLTFIVLAIFALVMFSSCEEEDNNDPENDETEVWEPYAFTPNTSFEYDYEYNDVSQEETSTGTFLIELGDPEVTISGTLDGEDFSVSENTSSDLSENFISAVSKTPLAMVLYQSYWTGAFSGQELEVGASWSFSYAGASMSYEVTGTDSYAGYEGYTIETNYQSDGEEVTINSCIHPDLPVALMVNMEEGGGDTYRVEMTNYED